MSPVTGIREATCAHCGARFTTSVRRGPAPTYCRPAHRQRAHEARRTARDRDELAALRAEVERLRVVEPAATARAVEKPRRRTTRKPWQAVQDRPDGTDPRVLSVHTTENAARRALRRERDNFAAANGFRALEAWAWRVEFLPPG